MRRGMGCVGSTLFVGIFFVVGVAVSWWGWRILQNARVSESWPATSGKVTYSQVRIDHDEDGTTYHAEVGFSYVVNDQRYSADTVSFGQYGSSSRNHADEIVARYPEEQTVTVYYNPAEPETAVLEPGVTWSSYMVLGIGLVFACVSIVIAPAMLLGRFRR